jgi:hypothetical protein
MGDLDTLIVDVQKQLGAIIQKVGGRARLPQQLFLLWFLCSTSPPSVEARPTGWTCGVHALFSACRD